MRSWIGGLGLFLSLGGAGCVPLSEYKALEQRYEEQEEYVTRNKNQVREFERREQVLTLRAREQEKQLELMRGRLEKSERLRSRGDSPREETVPASAARPVESPPQVMGLQVNPATQGLVLESGVVFTSGKSELQPKGKQILDQLVRELNSPKYAGKHVRIDGHTDDEPIQRTKGLNQSNWDLSGKRAIAVLHYLEEHGISGERLSFGGFGPWRPFAQGKNDSAKSQNRRVEVVLFER